MKEVAVKTVDDVIRGIVDKYGECYEAITDYDQSRRMSDIRKELMVELYINGYGVDAIANAVHRTRATVLHNLGHLSRSKIMAVPRINPKNRRGWKRAD